jgi:hypothetical protein
MLKMRAADSSKILVYCYKSFKEIAKDAGRRFFQNSGILLQMFQRKMLKNQAADSSKIPVHM